MTCDLIAYLASQKASLSIALWQASLSATIIGTFQSIPKISWLEKIQGERPALVMARASIRPADGASLRHTGPLEPFDEHITMSITAKIAAQDAEADGRPHAVTRLNEELRLLG